MLAPLRKATVEISIHAVMFKSAVTEMAFIAPVLAMVAFQAALSSAAAVIQFAPNSVNPEGSNILDVIANPEKNPAPRLPSFMVDMYEERHARFTSIPGKKLGKSSYRFNIPDDLRRDELVQHKVQLFLFSSVPQTLKVSVYDVESEERIFSFSLTSNGSEWMSQNLELGMKRGVRVQIEGAEVEQEPWLVYTDQSATPPPRKRRSSDQDTDKNSDACHKVDMIVNPTALGWSDWILPKVYNAFQCSGSCSRGITRENGTNHALVKMEIQKNNDTSESCCVPTKLSSLKVMTRKSDQFISREYINMVVETCGCSS